MINYTKLEVYTIMKKLLKIAFLSFVLSSCTSGKNISKSDVTKVSIEESESEENLNITFQIISAIGNLATFGAFIFLFIRDKDKQNQINKLTNLVSALKDLKDIENKKLNLSVRPDVKITSTMSQGTDGELQIEIENIGERTTLTKFELISEDLILHNEHLPFVMEKGTERRIFLRIIGKKHILACEYEIYIHHKDKIDNCHISIVKGKGINNKLTETKYNCS